MPPDQHGASRLEHLDPAAQHVEQVVLDDWRPGRRQGGDGERGLRRTSHRINVPRAWVAARRPNRYGSSTIARKKSTVCKSGGAPRNEINAASSGLSRPIITAPLVAGSRRPITRLNTAAGTLAAQPPQRIGSSPGSGSIWGNSV